MEAVTVVVLAEVGKLNHPKPDICLAAFPPPSPLSPRLLPPHHPPLATLLAKWMAFRRVQIRPVGQAVILGK